jgi:Sec-independent protein translocase protein TatA
MITASGPSETAAVETVVGTVLALLVLVALVGLVVWGVRALIGHLGAPDHIKAHRRELRGTRRELRRSTRAHDRAVSDATKQLQATEAAHRQRIEETTEQLRLLRDDRGELLTTYGQVSLYERFIETPGGSGPLIGVTAACDSAGELVTSQRATLTRMAAGGLALGGLGAILSLGFQKRSVDDRRELYLMIEGPGVAHVAKLDPDQGHRARQFAAIVNARALGAASAEAERPARIEMMEQRLQQQRADTAEIDAARRQLKLVADHGDSARRLEAARAELVRIEESAPAPDGPPPAAPPPPPPSPPSASSASSPSSQPAPPPPPSPSPPESR